MLIVAVIAIAIWIYWSQPAPPPKPMNNNFASKYGDLL
jgi:hypothetical protein